MLNLQLRRSKKEYKTRKISLNRISRTGNVRYKNEEHNTCIKCVSGICAGETTC